MPVKQMILVRKDLGMRKGKMIAQGAHASMKVLLDRAQAHFPVVKDDASFHAPPELRIPLLSKAEEEWVYGTFTKIVVGVDSEAELVRCYEEARAAGLPCAIIEDMGATEFHGVPTKTAVAIGPAEAADIAPITGGLTLL